MRTDIITTRGYSSNISGDELSLKIASYPATARYLAKRLKSHGSTVCELCCGIGVSLIELAKTFDRVVGIDNDPKIVEDCRHNLRNAGAKNFELLCGDVSDRKLLSKLSADIVLYDIPYWSSHAGQVDPDEQNPDLMQLITNVRELVTDKIVVYTPTHMTYDEAKSILGPCDFTKVYTNGKHDRNFIFLGELIERVGENEIEV